MRRNRVGNWSLLLDCGEPDRRLQNIALPAVEPPSSRAVLIERMGGERIAEHSDALIAAAKVAPVVVVLMRAGAAAPAPARRSAPRGLASRTGGYAAADTGGDLLTGEPREWEDGGGRLNARDAAKSSTGARRLDRRQQGRG
jgi:hypothetical protein